MSNSLIENPLYSSGRVPAFDKIEAEHVEPAVTQLLKDLEQKIVACENIEVAKKGDLVEFCEGRPTSKTKYMYLKRVIKSSSANG